MSVPWPQAIPALITALDENEEIDRDGHVANVGRAVDGDARGILIGGSTGQGPYLEPGERRALVAVTRAAFPDLVILSSIFAESHRQAVQQIEEAADAGADGLLVVTPTTLVRSRREWVVDYFEAVADTSPLPVFLYSVPAVTGYELPCESVAELAGHHNIAGMKDSGGDVTRLDAIASIMDDSFIVYAGNSRVLSESVASGAHGAITASSNYAFADVVGAIEGYTEAQERLRRLVGTIEPFGVPGTTFAASLAGMRSGPLRRPLPPLDAAAQEAIRAVLGTDPAS